MVLDIGTCFPLYTFPRWFGGVQSFPLAALFRQVPSFCFLVLSELLLGPIPPGITIDWCSSSLLPCNQPVITFAPTLQDITPHILLVPKVGKLQHEFVQFLYPFISVDIPTNVP